LNRRISGSPKRRIALLSRSLFPHAAHVAYLEHAALAPLALPVTAAVQRFLAERSGPVPNDIPSHFAAYERVRAGAAALIGAPVEHVELAPSTSWGLNLLALGYPWQPGDRVAVPACEFPANAFPWLQLSRFGVEVDLVPHTRGVVTVEDIEAALTSRTRLVAVSWVQYLSGYRLDLERLAEVVHAAGALLSVDATQGLGALQLDVAVAGVDFMAAGAQKWLLAMQGAAIVYVAPALQERLAPIRGWLNGPMAPDEEMDFAGALHPDARRFRVTAPAMEPVIALDASLAMLRDAGAPAVEHAVVGSATRLARGLDRAGLRRYGADEVSSGIVTFDHPDPAGAHAALREAGVHASVRNRRLRFSPHAYNDDDEIDLAIDVLSKARVGGLV